MVKITSQNSAANIIQLIQEDNIWKQFIISQELSLLECLPKEIPFEMPFQKGYKKT